MNTRLKGFVAVCLGFCFLSVGAAERTWIKLGGIENGDANAGTMTNTGYLALNPAGDMLYSAGNGEINWLARDTETGNLTHSGTFSSSPLLDNSSAIWISPDGNFLYVRTPENLVWLSIDPADGSVSYVNSILLYNSSIGGYRQLRASNGGSILYTFAYSSISDVLITYSRDASSGAVTPIDSIYLVGTFSMEISPDGGQLYVGVEGDTLHWYSIDAGTGLLTYDGSAVRPGTGGRPTFTFTPDGAHIYVITSEISHFFRDTTTGALTYDKTYANVDGEMGVVSGEGNQLLEINYHAIAGGGQWHFSWYGIDDATGLLSLQGSDYILANTDMLLEPSEKYLYETHWNSSGGLGWYVGTYIPEFTDAPGDMPEVILEDELYLDTLRATDADPGDELRYKMMTDPLRYTNCTDTNFAVLDSITGIITWTPTQCFIDVTYTMEYEVRDPYGAADTLVHDLYVQGTNDAPVITSRDPEVDTVHTVEVDGGFTVEFFVTSSDPDGGNDSPRYENFVDGIPVDSGYSYGFPITPTSSGVYEITTVVYDSGGASDSTSWTLIVGNLAFPPYPSFPRDSETMQHDQQFEWGENTDPDITSDTTYTLQIATDSTFDSVLHTISGIKGVRLWADSLLPKGLPADTLLAWRVMASGGGYETGYSQPQYFMFAGFPNHVGEQAAIGDFTMDVNQVPGTRQKWEVLIGIPPSEKGQKAQYNIRVFNLKGKNLADLHRGPLAPGRHKLFYSAKPGRMVSGLSIVSLRSTRWNKSLLFHTAE